MTCTDLPKTVCDRLLSLGVRPGDRCLVALSGGRDSTALLLAMLAGWGRGLTGAAHLDHSLRRGSEREQVWVRRLCDHWGVEIHTGRLDPGEVSSAAKRAGSLEAAMRIFRYGFLMSSTASMGARWLLTGHTADDQVETVLFRVFRRMNPMSLSGIPERRSRIVRPLLGIGRDVTSRYCMEMGVDPLEDPSNRDLRFARNRIRYRTIPALKAGFHPDLDEHVLRLSSLAGRMEAVQESILRRCCDALIGSEPATLPLARCRDLPAVLRESAVARFLYTGMGRKPSRPQVLEALEHLYGGKRGRMSLTGGKILDFDKGCACIYDPEHSRRAMLPEDPVELPVPGTVRFDGSGVIVTARYGTLKEPGRFPAGNTILIRRKGLTEPLRVRRRRPGDRFAPLGSGGKKKLKDFLIDRKVPRCERDMIPLVLDGEGEILWVAGIEISRKAALEGYPGEETVILRMEKVPG